MNAERQRYEVKLKDAEDDAQSWHERFEESQQKLLSALAAIEKHNKKCQNHVSLLDLVIAVDLSPLHEHVRKEQKPLVDLLRFVRATVGPCRDGVIDHTEAVRLVARIDAALAKVKGKENR